MKRLLAATVIVATLTIIGASTVQASIISYTRGASSVGGFGDLLLVAPADATDDAAFNTGIDGFNEQQFFTLTSDLAVDGGLIGAGTVVNSHMLFLNSGPGNNSQLIEHGAGGNLSQVSFTFDGTILGVMSTSNGSLEIASQFLGATGTLYPVANMSARGMEGNPLDGLMNDDWYDFSGDTIRLGMRVTEPGDWIRVVTAAVPEPSIIALFGLGLLGLGITRRRKYQA